MQSRRRAATHGRESVSENSGTRKSRRDSRIYPRTRVWGCVRSIVSAPEGRQNLAVRLSVALRGFVSFAVETHGQSPAVARGYSLSPLRAFPPFGHTLDVISGQRVVKLAMRADLVYAPERRALHYPTTPLPHNSTQLLHTSAPPPHLPVVGPMASRRRFSASAPQ